MAGEQHQLLGPVKTLEKVKVLSSPALQPALRLTASGPVPGAEDAERSKIAPFVPCGASSLVG